MILKTITFCAFLSAFICVLANPVLAHEDHKTAKGVKAEKCGCGKPKGSCADCKKYQNSTKTAANTKLVTLILNGLHCEGCEMMVTDNLMKVKGVKAAKVSHKTQMAVVTYDKFLPKVTELNTAVKKAGYRVVKVETAKPKS